jgi:hypothetical protein
MLFIAACGPSTPTKEQQIELAVAATLSSLPRNTAAPPSTPMPTFTPVALSGIFCEYQFCVGHPSDMAFYDVSAAQNQTAPSNYSQGILAAYNSKLFIQLVWQDAPGVTDPQFMLDLILQYGSDTRNGSIEPKIVGDLNVFLLPITPTAGAASTLPYGAAAAWLCSGRAFAWKAYTPQQELATTLMTDALARFRCESR